MDPQVAVDAVMEYFDYIYDPDKHLNDVDRHAGSILAIAYKKKLAETEPNEDLVERMALELVDRYEHLTDSELIVARCFDYYDNCTVMDLLGEACKIAVAEPDLRVRGKMAQVVLALAIVLASSQEVFYIAQNITAKRLGMKQPNLSSVIGKLVKQGWLERVGNGPKESPRTCQHYRLTAKAYTNL